MNWIGTVLDLALKAEATVVKELTPSSDKPTTTVRGDTTTIKTKNETITIKKK